MIFGMGWWRNFRKRISTWQLQYLSLGVGLTLISSVLDSMPTYFKSLFSFPKKAQDRIRRNFIWVGNSCTHKFHLITADKFLPPKANGGLGVKDLAIYIKSLRKGFGDLAQVMASCRRM